jgi:hypothetical protein
LQNQYTSAALKEKAYTEAVEKIKPAAEFANKKAGARPAFYRFFNKSLRGGALPTVMRKSFICQTPLAMLAARASFAHYHL